MRKLYVSLILSLLLVAQVSAQQTVQGKVTDDTGEALPGVNVVIKGTTTGVTTDLDGNYRISVEDGATLVFSYVGFQSQEISVGSRAIVDVVLGGATELQEVIVTAAGIERSEKSLGYSVGKVDSEELLKARETNVLNSLQGKVAGVTVTGSSGSIGGSSRILIRGAAALSDDIQPLFVVDGVPIFNSNIQSIPGDGGDTRFANDFDYGNTAQDINPDDIASISILKGGSAAALYGQRARNGVVVITTKKGKNTKGKTNITVNSSLRLDNVLRTPDTQSEFAPGTGGAIAENTRLHWGPRISGQNLPEGNWLGEEGPLTAYPDNFKNFFETGKTFINSVAIANGNESTNFRLGYTNTKQTGIIPNTGLTRNALSLNAGTVLENNISASIGIQYAKTDNDGRPGVGFNNSTAGSVYQFPNTIDIRRLRDYKDEFGVQRPLFDGETNNPYWNLNENQFRLDRDQLISNLAIQYDPFDNFNITGRIGYNLISETRFSPTSKGTLGAEDGGFFYDQIKQKQFNSDLILTYDRKITSDIGMKLIAGWNVNQRNSEQFTQRSTILAAPGVYRPANAEQNITNLTETTLRLYGLYFDVGFDYKDFLFFNVQGRNDWSSTLPKNNQSFFYPSVSTSFVFSEAFDLPDVISYGKFRGSWAKVGSDANPYALDFQYFPQTSVFFVLSGGTGLAYPFGGQVGYAQAGQIPNQQLRPEFQTSYEFGLEMQFFNNRFGFDVGYFNIRTDDQILGLPQSPSTGFFSRLLNVGTTSNEGWEVLLNGTPVATESFQWDVNVNFTVFRQEVVSLAPGVEELNLSGGINGLQVKATPGEPFALFGTGYLRDSLSGEFIINAQGFRESEDNVRLGDIYPDFTLGVGNTFSYKGVSLSFLLDYRQGGVLWSNTVSQLRENGLAAETLNREALIVDKGLVDDGDGNLVPNTTAVSVEDFFNNQSNIEESDTFENTWLKLREVRISYQLPKSLIDKTPFGSANLAVEGRNLAILFSKVPHIDPEQNVFGASDAGGGIEAGGVPSTRSIGFNLSLTF